MGAMCNYSDVVASKLHIVSVLKGGVVMKPSSIFNHDSKSFASMNWISGTLKTSVQSTYLLCLISEILNEEFFFFLYLDFLSQPFTNHGIADEGGGYFFNSSLPLPHAS